MERRWTDYAIGIIALAAFVLLVAENTAFGDAHAGAFRLVNLVILLTFAADVVARFLASTDKKVYLRRWWFDLIVFVPLIQYIPAIRSPSLFVLVRQVVIVVMLVSRSRRTRKLLQLLSLRPAQAMILGFMGAIGIGSVLLMLPGATAASERTSVVDAVFTATSAVCVTGLIVQDTATYFSPLGQLVILGLIQAGGLGIMTFSVSLAVLMRKPMDVRQRAALQDALDYGTLDGVRRLIRFIVLMTFALELCGALCLFGFWVGRFDHPLHAACHAGFHAVSAFCNAGFSTFSDSLVGFRTDVPTNVIICLLIVAGGLGFMAIRDLGQARRQRRTRVQTKVVLTMTAVLIAAGAALVFVVERGGLLEGMSLRDSIIASVFQSVTARTAGFNTLDIGRLSSATLLVTMVLMFIGASPGSTAGGIKTTTVATLWAAVVGSLRNRPHTELWSRTLPPDVVLKAVTVLCISLVIVGSFALALLCVEGRPFLDILFETVSAFGTVGLSTGVTPDLSAPGKLLITALMFIGRLGPLTIAYALVGRRTPARYKFAEERIMIG